MQLAFFFFAKRKPVHLEAANVLFPVKILSFVCLMTNNFELDKYLFLRLCFSLVTFFKTFTHDCFIPGPIEENTKVGTIFLSGLSYLLGSLCNDDGDGNKNVKRVIGLLRKITLHTCIPILSFFSTFFVVTAPRRREMPNCTFYGGRKQEATKFSFFFLT